MRILNAFVRGLSFNEYVAFCIPCNIFVMSLENVENYTFYAIPFAEAREIKRMPNVVKQ